MFVGDETIIFVFSLLENSINISIFDIFRVDWRRLRIWYCGWDIFYFSTKLHHHRSLNFHLLIFYFSSCYLLLMSELINLFAWWCWWCWRRFLNRIRAIRLDIIINVLLCFLNISWFRVSIGSCSWLFPQLKLFQYWIFFHVFISLVNVLNVILLILLDEWSFLNLR